MSVAITRQGDTLLAFDRVAERDAARFQPLTYALIDEIETTYLELA
jgi:hypothetical protein